MGMKQRLGIAGALLGDPDLLVLDEPTNGLDPVGMREIRELIGEIASDDRTVLVSSHLLVEIEQVCDWLIVIERGAGVFAGPAAEFVGGGEPVDRRAPRAPARRRSARPAPGRRGLRRRAWRASGCSSTSASATPGPSPSPSTASPIEHGLVLAELEHAPPQPAGPLPRPRRRRHPMIRSIRAELIKLTRPTIRSSSRASSRRSSPSSPPRSACWPPSRSRRAVRARASTRCCRSRPSPTPAAARRCSPRRRRSAPCSSSPSSSRTVAGELTRGTFRTMLLQQPNRGRVLAGKMVAIVGFAAAAVPLRRGRRLDHRPPRRPEPGHRHVPLDLARRARRRRRGLRTAR